MKTKVTVTAPASVNKIQILSGEGSVPLQIQQACIQGRPGMLRFELPFGLYLFGFPGGSITQARPISVSGRSCHVDLR